jgi:uncharacterized protein (DUF4415 family)
MNRVVDAKYRDIDLSRGKRGPVIKPESGKSKISIRLDNAVLEHIQRRSTLEAVRQVVREALAPYGPARGTQAARSGKRPKG